ncbi:MAG: hypothetical protein JW896_10225, partial [Deltaproteobacteria bacterium]|nr:hypothetical protein [Deltaproteobacteria bacterium]
MKSIKGSIRMISILSILTFFGVLNPMITDASVAPALVDFGEVEIGSSSTRTLNLINTNTVPIDIDLSIDGDTCGFSVNPGLLSLGVGESGFIEVSYTPSEPNSCSATLIVEIIDSQEGVQLIGVGVVSSTPTAPPPPPPPPPPP